MIEHARASITEIDARIERVAAELDSLNALRAGWERYLALAGAPIDSADQGVRSGTPAAEPEPGDDPPVASAPATQPPGRGRDGSEAQQRGGRQVRRAAPSTSAPSAAASPLTCSHPGCGRTFDSVQRLGSHRFQAHERVRNPRSAPPLELPPRADQVVGE